MSERRTRWSFYAERTRALRSMLLGDQVARVLALPRGRSGYARYERVRERGPLVRGRQGLCMTATYQVCDQLLRSSDFGAVPTGVSRDRTSAVVHPLDDSFPAMDPPEHTRLRHVVAPWFTPRAMSGLRPFVERTVSASLDHLDRAAVSRDGVVDLVSEFALRVPSEVICHLLGLPRADHARFVRWGLEFGAVVDGARTPRDLTRTFTLLDEMARYFTARLAHSGADAGAGILHRLGAAVARGEMSETAALATSESLLIGGFITTANIIGNGALALLDDPEQRNALITDPGAAANAVEEALRYEAPAQYCVRVVKRQTSLGGHALSPGTPVVALLAAANRDPAVFTDPNRFDIARTNARDHLSFAAGIHYCIGAGLARMEADVALRGLFERFPSLRRGGRVRYCPSRVIRGPARLPVLLR